MNNYWDMVEEDAKDFLLNHKDGFVEALESDTSFYYLSSKIFDYFTTEVAWTSDDGEEALEVIARTDNEETDTGLWEGKQPEEAIIIKAYFCYQNDVKQKIEDIYEELRDEFENRQLDDDNQEFDEHELAQEVFDEMLQPPNPKSEEE